MAIPSLRRHARAGRALARHDAPLELGPEMADQALDRPGRRVAERADGVALDLARDLFEQVDLGDLGVAGRPAAP